MSGGFGTKASWTLAVLGLSALAGCGAPGEEGSGLGNALLLAGTTVPPAQARPIDDVYCPPVTVIDGGSMIQLGRNQVTLGELARECIGQPDGSTLVKVGVEARALMGSGGSAGRFDVPVQFVVKDGSTIFASRSRRVPVAIPSGDTLGRATAVESGIVVPAVSANSFEIQVGLGRRG